MKLPLYTRKDSQERGRHLVAACPLSKNQLIFVERPLLALQSLHNMSTNLVCSHCFATMGSLDTRWGLVSGRYSKRQVDDSTIIQCRSKCGHVYCCNECKEDAWKRHALLCTGCIEDNDHPLIQFKVHAVEHNEIFLMVADAVVGMLLDTDFCDKMLDFCSTPWWHVATEPLLKSPAGLADATFLDGTLRRLCHESSALLKQALVLHKEIDVARVHELCTTESFGKLIGAFEQNAIGIRQRNPLCRSILDTHERRKYHKDLMECLKQAGMMSDVDETKGSHNEYSDDEIAHFLASLEMDEQASCDDLDGIFTPLDGTAMYATACKMNHSCHPNVVVLYKQPSIGKMPLCIHIVALRDIEEGEELCISYIDSIEPVESRREELGNYGFECQCEKCVRESNACSDAPRIKEEDNDLDEEDLFGPEDDDDECDDEANVDNSDIDNDQVDGATALQSRLTELDKALNKSVANIIPTHVLGVVCSYVILVGSAGASELPDSLLSPLEQCLEAVRQRDFVLCCKVGSQLEDKIYSILEANGSWPSVAHQQAYGSAALACSIGNLHVGSILTSQTMLDKAFILGVPRDEIVNFFGLVEYFANQAARGPLPPAVECHVECSIPEGEALEPLPFAIPECSPGISSKDFESQYVSEPHVAVFRGFAADWIATEKWRNLSSLVQDHGHRLVPIELGSMMKSDGMKEQAMSFRSFVTSFLVPSSQKSLWTLADAADVSFAVAYLAQHPLLDQISELCRDIKMSPRLCSSPPSHRNVWMGTGGTRTPLHFDSYDNLLIQIVGYKYVRVYDTCETDSLYVIRGSGKNDISAQGNMSAVNCEMEDFEEHPLAQNAKYQAIYLGPGDCLFLPARMWHYVRSLSTSISVNFWYG